ncbi:MAG: hypothetical protein EA394_07475 [Bacteroidia bacterium]|nr:MAG: hypothetical protein EA394_07475 [Bacteroidia bacterium]
MKSNQSARVIIGLLFLVLGAFILLRLTGLIDLFHVPVYIVSWPVILLVLGIVFIVSDGSRSTGVVLVAIGAFFLTKNIFGLSFSELLIYTIPVILIIAGVSLLFPAYIRKKKQHPGEIKTERGNDIQAVDIFGGGSRTIESSAFRGGDLFILFGGTELFFREAELADEVNVIDVFCMFGALEIYAPADWKIKVEATSVFAGTSDKRFPVKSDQVTGQQKTLLIKGFFMFAGLEIKSL